MKRAKKMKLHNWNVDIVRDQIIIESLYLYPGEADKLINLLSFSQGMSDLDLLPDDIGDPPFRIDFSDLRELTVSRIDSTKVAEFIGLHDTVSCPGVKQAMDEFLRDNPIYWKHVYHSPICHGFDLIQRVWFNYEDNSIPR